MTQVDKTESLVEMGSKQDDSFAAELSLAHVRGLSRAKVNEYAAAYVLQMIRTERRRRVAEVEREAFAQREAARAAILNSPEKVAERSEIDRAYQAREQESWKRFSEEMTSSLNAYALQMHVKWTAELLEAKFARADGSTVSWGDATRADHEYRVEMHSQHALTGMQGAARHMQAIETLDEAQAATLNEAVSKLAA